MNFESNLSSTIFMNRESAIDKLAEILSKNLEICYHFAKELATHIDVYFVKKLQAPSIIINHKIKHNVTITIPDVTNTNLYYTFAKWSASNKKLCVKSNWIPAPSLPYKQCIIPINGIIKLDFNRQSLTNVSLQLIKGSIERVFFSKPELEFFFDSILGKPGLVRNYIEKLLAAKLIVYTDNGFTGMIKSCPITSTLQSIDYSFSKNTKIKFNYLHTWPINSEITPSNLPLAIRDFINMKLPKNLFLSNLEESFNKYYVHIVSDFTSIFLEQYVLLSSLTLNSKLVTIDQHHNLPEIAMVEIPAKQLITLKEQKKRIVQLKFKPQL